MYHRESRPQPFNLSLMNILIAQLKQKQITLTSIRWTLHIIIRCSRHPEFFSVFARGPYLHSFLTLIDCLFFISFLLFPDIFLSPSPSSAPKSMNLISLCDALQRGSLLSWSPVVYVLCGRARRTASAPQLLPSGPSQHSVLETRSVGGRQLHARHTLGRVLLAFLPFKPL